MQVGEEPQESLASTTDSGARVIRLADGGFRLAWWTPV